MDISEHREEELQDLHARRDELLLSQKPYNMNFHTLPASDPKDYALATAKKDIYSPFTFREQQDNVNSPAHYTKGGIYNGCRDWIAIINTAITKYNWK